MTLPPLFMKRPFLFGGLLILSIAIGSAFGSLLAMYHDLPAVRGLGEYRPNVVTKILSSDGQKIAELYLEKRFWVPYDTVPQTLIDAILATEDDEFFKHKGLRLLSILRALAVDIRMGRMAQGGSTITQQLAKQLFLTPEKSVTRKIREALLAIQMERKYTKREILELYLNQIYLGSGAYGVEAASRVYFGKTVGDLDLAEAALIAGLPRAPSRYSPFKNLNLAEQRRATVLSRMKVEGYITTDEEKAANAEPIRLAENTQEKSIAPHFVETVRKYLEKTYGPERVYREGLTVYTTLDTRLQEAAEEAVREGVAEVNEHVNAARLYSDGVSVEGALTAVRPQDGAVLAMVGGVDFAKSRFNRAVQAKRQPGSAFKPFIYLAAIQKDYSPADMIVDSPVSFPDPQREGMWKPVNFSNRFYGPVTLRKALENSMNVATVKLLNQIGVGPVIELARKCGIKSPLPEYLSLGLGAAEVSLLELTSAYSTFANMGLRAAPYFIRSVRDGRGEILERREPAIYDAVRPEAAYVLTKMLQGVVENGTGKAARALNRPVAGKTGTTDENKDAWFVGYTPTLTAGVWIGFDDNRPMGKGETGGATAAPVWTRFMAEALRNRPVKDFTPPERVVVRVIDRDTGKLATSFCHDTLAEVFVEGTEPIEFCREQVVNGQRL